MKKKILLPHPVESIPEIDEFVDLIREELYDIHGEHSEIDIEDKLPIKVTMDIDFSQLTPQEFAIAMKIYNDFLKPEKYEIT